MVLAAVSAPSVQDAFAIGTKNSAMMPELISELTVTDDRDQVGNVLKHGTLPDHLVVHHHLLAVHLYFSSTTNENLQASRSDNDIRFDLSSTILQDDALFVDSLDVPCCNVAFSRSQRFEEIAVWAETKPLVPRAVRRREMWVEADVLRQLCFSASVHEFAGFVWECLAEVEEEIAEDEVFDTHQPVCKRKGKVALDEVDIWILGWQSADV